MDTERATGKLAEIYRTGDADSREERAAERHLWTAADRAGACDWDGADYSLEAAYHALGAEPPAATADDLALGRHPIQVEAGRRHREETAGD